MKYRAEIDGLRALSVIPIILFHANIGLLNGGFIGVDIFFVISGYLITTILIDELDTGRYSIVNFYARRARRILPALTFVLILATFFAAMTLTPLQLEEYFNSLFSVFIFSSNIYFWTQSGYFAPQMEYNYLLHTWSLAVEEQYYLLFPIFLSATWRFGKKSVLIGLILLAAASFAFCLYGEKHYTDGNYYLTPSRMWELFAGAIAAFVLDGRKINGNNSLSLLGLALIAVPMFIYDETTPFPSAYALPPILGVVLLIIYCTQRTWVARMLSLKPMVGIGLISYSVYLWHQVFLVYLRLAVPPFTFLSEHKEWVAVILTFAVSIFSYYYVEQPFRKKKPDRFPPLGTVLTAAALLLVMSGASLLLSQKTELFFSDDSLALMKSAKRSNTKSCSEPQNLCSTATEKIDVLLLGDSNAYHFSTVLDELAKTHNKRFVNMTLGGCLPLSQFYRLDQKQVTTEKCRNFNAAVKTALEQRELDGAIVLSAAWLLYPYSTNLYADETDRLGLKPISVIDLSGDGATSLGANRQTEFLRYIEDTIAFLSTKTNHLIVVGPIPPAVVNFQKHRSLLSQRGSPRAVYDEFSAPIDAKILMLQGQYTFTYLKPADMLCDASTCHVADSQGYLYGDPTHLSRHGQTVVMKPLLEKALFRTQ